MPTRWLILSFWMENFHVPKCPLGDWFYDFEWQNFHVPKCPLGGGFYHFKWQNFHVPKCPLGGWLWGSELFLKIHVTTFRMANTHEVDSTMLNCKFSMFQKSEWPIGGVDSTFPNYEIPMLQKSEQPIYVSWFYGSKQLNLHVPNFQTGNMCLSTMWPRIPPQPMHMPLVTYLPT